MREKYGLSERHACRIVGQHRGTQRYVPMVPADEDALTRAIVALASEYGRYGYRRVTALLQAAGWQVGKDRVQRIWRREGLKVPQKHRPRSRLWLNGGSCVRLRPQHRNHVWSFDFVQAQTHDGRSLRVLTLIDDLTLSLSKGQPRLPGAEGGTAHQQHRRDRGAGRRDVSPRHALCLLRSSRG